MQSSEGVYIKKGAASACNSIKKETPTQVFSREFYENFKNTCFAEH